MYVCMYVCMHVCMYVCTHVCMCVHMCLYVCMYVRMYVTRRVETQYGSPMTRNARAQWVSGYPQIPRVLELENNHPDSLSQYQQISTIRSNM